MGTRDESWTFMRVLRSLGGEDWFQLGDGDLALHALRTAQLRQGATLSEVTARVCRAWQVGSTILPMSDDPVRTQVHTDEGVLAFQRYFVERRCAPRTHEISFEGAAVARPAPGVTAAIETADIVVIAPSNPYLSIDPILSVAGISEAIKATTAPVVAVSPLVSGKAVKGPTDKLMKELGFDVGHDAIVGHYQSSSRRTLIHEGDAAADGGPVLRTANTLMRDDADRDACGARRDAPCQGDRWPMSWTVIIPLNTPAKRKSRLSGALAVRPTASCWRKSSTDT